MIFDLKELKHQRQRKDLTLEDMAKKLNMPVSSYQKREKGKVKLSMGDFTKIVKVLELKGEEILIFFKRDVDKKKH